MWKNKITLLFLPDPSCEVVTLNASLNYLDEPIHSSSIVLFRIAYGVLAFLQLIIYFPPSQIHNYYYKPDVLFPWVPNFIPSQWIQPLPFPGMYVVYGLVIAGSLGILLGYYYRISLTVFLINYGYMHLLDVALFYHHHFLILFLGFILLFTPAHRRLSVDLYRRQDPGVVRRWQGWLLRFQMLVVYFFAGVSKLNGDWILRGQPLKIYLEKILSSPSLLQSFLPIDVVTATGSVILVANGVLLLELLSPVGLLWKKSRNTFIGLFLLFNLLNALVLPIGVFPWLSMAGTLLFLPWDWTKNLERLHDRLNNASPPTGGSSEGKLSGSRPGAIFRLLFATVFVVFQTVMPLRQFWTPGNRLWTNSGFRLSWAMFTNYRRGYMQFLIRKNEKTRKINYRKHLNKRQIGYLQEMPPIILKYARFLGNRYDAESVHAYVVSLLNDRPPALFVNPEINLLNVSQETPVTKWIEPFPDRKHSDNLPPPPQKPDLPENHPIMKLWKQHSNGETPEFLSKP